MPRASVRTVAQVLAPESTTTTQSEVPMHEALAAEVKRRIAAKHELGAKDSGPGSIREALARWLNEEL